MIEKVRNYVIETCEKLNRIEDYKYHISVVEEICVNLAKRFNANEEILRISALLHDIGRIKFGPKNHEETGAIEAEKILKEFNLENEKIEKIKECIREHRHEKPSIPISLEAKILKIADAYAHFKKAIYLPYFHIKFGNAGIEEAIEWAREKLERDLNFLKEMSKEIDIKDIVKECQEIYEFFCRFIL